MKQPTLEIEAAVMFGPSNAATASMQRGVMAAAIGTASSSGIAQEGYEATTTVVRVLFGNYEPLLNGFIAKMLERFLGNHTRVRWEETGGAAKLIHFAHRDSFDLVVLILNNIRYDLYPADPAHQDLPACGLDLVRRLKQAMNVPLLAMASAPWEMDPALPEKLRSAGANWFLSLPFQEEDLYACLRRVFSRGEEQPQELQSASS